MEVDCQGGYPSVLRQGQTGIANAVAPVTARDVARVIARVKARDVARV